MKKMKYILLIFLGALLYSNASAQGIKFEHGTYEEALAKAKKESKLVFIDCYTAWCGPCKKLSKTVFTQEEVGTFFNKNFVCIKVDMEKGEGVELGVYYNVRGYPTLLFLDDEGEICGRVSGFTEAKALIEKAKKALGKK